MTGSADSPLRRVLWAPFTRRAWAELIYAIVSFPLAVCCFTLAVVTMHNGPLMALSAPWVRKLGAANRSLARTLLDQDVPPPAQLVQRPYVVVRTPDAAQLAELAKAEGANVSQRGDRVRTVGLSVSRITELTADGGIAVHALRPNKFCSWYITGIKDLPAWRARAYIAIKVLVAAALLAAAGFWVAGLACLTYPIWWVVDKAGMPLGDSFLFVPLGAVMVLAAPWAVRAVTVSDRVLISGMLGPAASDSAALAERVRDLEKTRAHAVDDSAARLRNIERDLHDGAQAQLVALAMKLGLAKDKIEESTPTAPADLNRIAQLVDDAHRSAIAAIAELRTLARGIHPSVLDNGLTDALSTLAARSAVPVELIADVPERPSAAIETIGYFSAAELLANVAKHSGARHATLEAVHVPGLLRIRVTDDGNGGASPVPGGGLSGLADRVRTVDGRLDIDSPRGGPTVVTVELPSHA